VSSAFDSLRAGVPTEGSRPALSRKLWQTIFELSRCRDSFAQGGVTMRDCSKDRAGFDRVLIAVAATFLAVSATSALAQSDAPRASAAELAIDAAIPRPQPANLPPPTADDFKLDATASVPPKQIELPRPAANTSDPKPTETTATAPAAPSTPVEAPKSDT